MWRWLETFNLRDFYQTRHRLAKIQMVEIASILNSKSCDDVIEEEKSTTEQ